VCVQPVVRRTRLDGTAVVRLNAHGRTVPGDQAMDNQTEREHDLSVDCWCQPVVEHYGYGVEEDDEGDQRGPVGTEPGAGSPP